MTKLEFKALRLTGARGHVDLEGTVKGERIALVGDWQPLLEVLAGRSSIQSGLLLSDSRPARDRVLCGELGVCDETLEAPAGYDVRGWIGAAMLLRGSSSRAAKRCADATLERLGLSYLASYDAVGLPPVARWAAQAAIACATHPSVVLLAPPQWTADSIAFESALIDRIASGSSLLVRCDPSRQPELFMTCERALRLADDGSLASFESSRWASDCRYFAVLPSAQREAFVQRLETEGIRVLASPTQGELWVELSNDGDTAPILRAAAAARAPLQRLTPLFQSPNGLGS